MTKTYCFKILKSTGERVKVISIVGNYYYVKLYNGISKCVPKDNIVDLRWIK